MTETAIFQPVATLAIWTLLVLGLVPLRRFAAARKQTVTAEDFKFGESARVPSDVSIPNRAWMNLLEAPVLFYVAMIVAFLTQGASERVVQLAWGYVALRIVHTLVHVTYNNVFHRLIAFALSNLVLIVIWVSLAIDLWTA